MCNVAPADYDSETGMQLPQSLRGASGRRAPRA